MQSSSARFLFAGTTLAAAGYGATFLSAILIGIGYGLVYPVIQTWAVNDAEPHLRHAALTWFVLCHFIGIFGFPVQGGLVLIHLGKQAFLALLHAAALLEHAIVLVPAGRAPISVEGAR
jgi:hypothetical protein